MSFSEAIRSVFSQYAGFAGRARRSEYWYWLLFTVVLTTAASLLDRPLMNRSAGIVSIIVGLVLILPNLAVGCRRLHDIGRSGWWQLIGLTGIGGIVLLVFFAMDSQGDNRYGPSPKPIGAAYPAPAV
jgi:uncharacterized membrane protein YhaH (DUF805 family)